MPPVERTVAKPLSGAEVVEAIVHRIRQQLQRDCFLAGHLAYASFSMQAQIRVQFQNTGTAIKETTVHANEQGGQVTDAEMKSVDVDVTSEPQPPNQARIETGQGVPAVVTRPQGGVEEKKLKYGNPPMKTSKGALAAK